MPTITTSQLMKLSPDKQRQTVTTEELLGGRDEVFGLSPGSTRSLTAKLRPVLEGTKQLEELLPEHQREPMRQMIDLQEKPAVYRERLVAEMLLADKLNQSKDVVQRQYDMIVENLIGPKAVGNPAMVVDALSPYKRLPVLQAGKEPNYFVKLWESVKGKIGIEPDIGFFESGGRFSRERARGPLAAAALGTEKLKEKEEFERKGLGEAVSAGFSQAGVRMAKSVAGIAQAMGEFADKLPKRYDSDTASQQAEWGRMMAEGADLYFAEHPDEAQQLQPGTGILGTVWQFISRPELIVQGVVETIPMLAEAWLGHITGTKTAQVIGRGAKALPIAGRMAAMAPEIFGVTYSDARQNNKTPEQALGEAFFTTVGEVALEEWSLEKKIGIFRGVAGSTARHQMARAGAKIILGTRDSFQRGFIEEGGQAVNANFWDMVFSDTSLTEDFFARITEGVTEEAAAGGVLETALGGLFNISGSGYRFVTDRTASERIEQLRSIVNKTTGMSAEQKTEANAELDRQRSDILAGKFSRQGSGEATAAFRESAKRAFNIDDKQAAAAMALVQAKADAENKTTDQWLTENIESVRAARFEQGQILFQEEDVEIPKIPREGVLRIVKARWEAIKSTYINAADAQEALPGVPFKNIFKLSIRDKNGNVIEEQFVERGKHQAAGKALADKHSDIPHTSHISFPKPFKPKKGEPSFERWKKDRKDPDFEKLADIDIARREVSTKQREAKKEEKFQEEHPLFFPPTPPRDTLFQEFGPDEDALRETGITNRDRRRTIKTVQQQIRDNEVFQVFQEGQDRRLRVVSRHEQFFVSPELRGDVEQITGKPFTKGFNKALHNRFTFDRQEGATDFTEVVQELLTIEDPVTGIADTSAQLDIATFVNLVDEQIRTEKLKGGISPQVLELALQSGDRELQLLAELLEGLEGGDPVSEINNKLIRIAESEGISEEDMASLLLPEPTPDLIERAERGKKAAAQFAEDGKATLIAFEKADLSSLLHELGHVFRRTLDGRDLAAVERWVGVENNNWTINNEEKFARGFEKYLLDGKAPNHRLRSTFARLRQWLRAIYDNLRNSPLDINISPEVRKAFDNMFVVREIHPGEMTFDEFIDKLGVELMDKNSLWIERFGLAVRETPFQMHQRLQKEWKAQQAEITLGFTEEALESPLTNDQKLQINIIEASVLRPTAKAIADQKGLTVEELLDQNEGDRIVLAEVKRQLRAAFRAGNQAGIDAAKKRFTDIATRARARKQLREHIKELARKIAKRAPATVDLLQREAIAALQAGIDPSFRASRTLTQRQRVRDFLANNPEAGIPKKLAAIISKKALNEYTIADLEALAAERERLETIGKTKKRLRLEQEQRRRDELSDQIVDNIRADTDKTTTWITPDKVDGADITLTQIKVEADGIRYDVRYKGMSVVDGPQLVDHEDDSPERLKQRVKRWLESPQPAPINSATTKQNVVLKWWKNFRANTLTPTRIFDLFDGGKATFDGPMHEAFADAVNQATDAKLRMMDQRADAGQVKLDELGITIRDLAGKRIVNGIEYSVQELLGIYGFNQNYQSRLALQFGNNIGAKTIADIIHHVETEDPRLAELTNWIIEEFDEHFERLEAAWVEGHEKRLEKVERYLAMRRRELDYTPDERQINMELIERAALKKAYAAKGFTISRQDISPEHQKPIRLDLWSIWQEQVTRQEHFIHLDKLTSDLHKITSGQGFKDAVTNKYGKEYLKVVRDYVNRVANPHIYKSYGHDEVMSRMLRKHAAVSYLSYNVVTVLKQLPSVLFYLADAGPQHLLASSAEFFSNPKGLIDKVRRLDPQVAHPALERVLEELKINDQNQYQQIITRIGKNGMRMLYMMDSVARTIGWNAVYRNALDPTTTEGAASEAEAIRRAQASTLRGQPAANAKDISAIYTKSETLNWFLMFTNQISKIYGIATYDMPRQLGNGQVQKGMLQLAGLSISALVMWSISNRRLPEEPEDFADAIKDQAINMIPLIGAAIMRERRGFGESGIGAISELTKLLARLEEIAAGKGDEKDMNAVLEALAVLLGIPTVQPKRVIKAITEEDLAELIGGGSRNRR